MVNLQDTGSSEWLIYWLHVIWKIRESLANGCRLSHLHVYEYIDRYCGDSEKTKAKNLLPLYFVWQKKNELAQLRMRTKLGEPWTCYPWQAYSPASLAQVNYIYEPATPSRPTLLPSRPRWTMNLLPLAGLLSCLLGPSELRTWNNCFSGIFKKFE